MLEEREGTVVGVMSCPCVYEKGWVLVGGKGSSYTHGLFIHTEEGRKDGS